MQIARSGFLASQPLSHGFYRNLRDPEVTSQPGNSAGLEIGPRSAGLSARRRLAMRSVPLAAILICLAALPTVVVSDATAVPPRLIQAGCDTVITGQFGTCEQARITFSLDPISWPVCSFRLEPAGSSLIYECAGPPGWRCQCDSGSPHGSTWGIDPSAASCPTPPGAQVDGFSMVTSSAFPVCLTPQCGGCPGNPIATAFSATFFDSGGSPIFSSIPFTVMCEIAPVPVLVSTWGSLKAVYR